MQEQGYLFIYSVANKWTNNPALALQFIYIYIYIFFFFLFFLRVIYGFSLALISDRPNDVFIGLLYLMSAALLVWYETT